MFAVKGISKGQEHAGYGGFLGAGSWEKLELALLPDIPTMVVDP